ncbi:MAG TPA: GNAT family N-acetyltransferase [Thermoplasmata archaeon]|nr:GNAT family N-acetyltransferase [Thermoplasmata archaeon]
MVDPRPATDAPLDVLEGLLQDMRRKLELRDEAPSGAWVERSAGALRAGRQAGWFLPDGAGLALVSVRDADAFGHVHVGPGPGAVERAERLATILLGALPAPVQTAAVGFTGLAVEDERAVLATLAQRKGSTLIGRRAMERALGPEDGAPVGAPPAELRFVPIRAVTIESLAELDARAFAGSVDAMLVGSDPAHYREVLGTVLGGELGLFLDEASTALYRPDPPRLYAALLSTERSARRAVFVDFMVDPEFRHRGLGTFLLRWGLRALWALGYARVRLWVSDENLPARRLYEAHGFRATATAVIYRWSRTAEDPHAHPDR